MRDSIAAIGPQLQAALVDCPRVEADEAHRLTAAWPWPERTDDVVTGRGEPPPGWTFAETGDWVHLALAARQLRLPSPRDGFLCLGDDGPLWRIDLGRYPALLDEVLALSADHDYCGFGFVAADGGAGILGRSFDAGRLFVLCAWGLVE